MKPALCCLCLPFLVALAVGSPSVAAAGLGLPAARALENFDTRWAEPQAKSAEAAAREAAVNAFRARFPELRVERKSPVRGLWIHSPAGFLSGPGGEGRAVAKAHVRAFAADDGHRPVKAFLDAHAALLGHGAGALAEARKERDFVHPRHGLRTTAWQQELGGVPIFDGILIAHSTRAGELVSLFDGFVSDAALAEARRSGLAPAPGLQPEQAIRRAAAHLGQEVRLGAILPATQATSRPEGFVPFRAPRLKGDALARLVWLPSQSARLELCWEVLLTPQVRDELYRLLIHAQTGEVLVRHCFTEQLSDASFRVYAGESPTAFSPGWPSPNPGQPPEVARTLITLDALNTNASPAGWIQDGENETRGNNVDAYLDRDSNNEPDLPRTEGTPFRVFDFPIDLLQPPSRYGPASVVNAFYWCNWMHDRLYDLGFTELAGNFQQDNFGRGGAAGDALKVEVQGGEMINNSRIFALPYDGVAARMELFLFTGANPARDAALDAGIILHEYAHGLTCRRVGAAGVSLEALQSRGLGEGWSDFYSLSLLSRPGDDPNAVYVHAAYASFLLHGLQENYYFGARRYPYSTDRTKNPLTLKDIDPAQLSGYPGVPRNPMFSAALANAAAEEHNQGEVWCLALWEARANLIAKHGPETGNILMLQLVTDALGLTPPNPDFVEARDAILLADRVSTGGANQAELWAGFAKRGLGVSATVPSSLTTTGVREAFDLPDALQVRPNVDFGARCDVGGPVTPVSITYTLTNAGSNQLTWSATPSADWLSLTPSSGSLAPGADDTVRIEFNAAAAALGPGLWTNLISWNDLTTGRAQYRVVRLGVGLGVPDPLTDWFESDFDLENTTLTFVPDGSSAFYSVCRETAWAFPTDPGGGTLVYLENDASVPVALRDGATVPFFGQRTNVFYISSNGYLTFDGGDQSTDTSGYFTRRRMSALMSDLDPASQGTISWKQLPDRVAVTFDAVPQHGLTNSNSFQYELFFDGRLRLTWLRMDTRSGVSGLSRGTGFPTPFIPSQLSRTPRCVEPRLEILATTLVEEGLAPPNGCIDPGETVTLAVAAANVGGSAATNLWLGLLPSDNVLAPSAPSQVGELPPGAMSTNLVTFTATGPCGAWLDARFEWRTGTTLLGQSERTLSLGAPSRLSYHFAHRAAISVPAAGLGDPYPSTNLVTGVTGTLTRVSVTLADLNSPSRDGLKFRLIGPQGQKVGLLTGGGDGSRLEHVSLVLEDEGAPLPPPNLPLTSGSYRPMGERASDPLESPYLDNFSQFANTDPNGVWSLYVLDGYFGSGGTVANGWVIHLETSNSVAFVNPLATDLQLTQTSPASARVGDPLPVVLTISNAGPATATAVTLSNPVPANTVFLASFTSQGSGELVGSNIICQVGEMAVGAVVAVTNVFRPGLPGPLSLDGRVSSGVLDHNQLNNAAAGMISVAPPALSLTAPSAVEGDSGFTNCPVQVVLSGPSLQTVSVDFRTLPGDANVVPGLDYLPTNGTLVFAPGVTTQAFTICILADKLYEESESIRVELSNELHATLASTWDALQIIDDDPLPPLLAINDAPPIPSHSGVTQAVFSVSLSAPSDLPTWVDFETRDFTAASNRDYVASSGTLEIPAGATNAAIPVTMKAGGLDQAGGIFFVFLSNARNARLGRHVGICLILGDGPSVPPAIVVASTALLGESFTPTNGCLDPGETVSVGFALQNLGGGSPSLTATLLNTGGVLAAGGPQFYGALSNGAAPVQRPFAFTANGLCGGTLHAVLRLECDGTNFALLTNQMVLGRQAVLLAETFDATNALPAGWSNSDSGSGLIWMLDSSFSQTPPNAAYMFDPPLATDRALISPPLTIATSSAQLSFWQRTALGSGSGAVLEIAWGDGGFIDILAAGGSFVSGGYTHTMSGPTALAGRMAWSGSAPGFAHTVVNLPAAAAGQTVRLSWRFVSAGQNPQNGWYVDTVSVTEVMCQPPPLSLEAPLNQGAEFCFSFPSVAGRIYWVEFTDSLDSAHWQPLRAIPGDGQRQIVTNALPASGQRFYRVRLPAW